MTEINRFKNERKKIGYTQEQVAKKLNTSRSNVANWENGQNMPSLDLLFKCSDLYNCDVMYLAGYQKERRKTTEDIPPPEPENSDCECVFEINKIENFVEYNINSLKRQIMNLPDDIMSKDNKKSLIDMVDYFHTKSTDNNENK